jgi:hypothetical protein
MPNHQVQMSTDLLENCVPRDGRVTQNLIPIIVPLSISLFSLFFNGKYKIEII